MDILVVGRGGREHSLIQKMQQSDHAGVIYAAPGNAGMAEDAICVDIAEESIEELVLFAGKHAIDLTVVGPENPLMEGIADHFLEAGLPIFAPAKEAAMLEGSKRFAKAFMHQYDIPTPGYQAFNDPDEAKAYIQKQGAPVVVKADGLAAGKGVIVAETTGEAIRAVDDMLVDRRFADAGATIVVEECLRGEEFSLMGFVHGENVYPMITAKDHKRAYTGDEGPNTGGMGAYAPVPDVTEKDYQFTVEHILQKAASGMVAEGRSFTGILYAGMMMTDQGPQVIEFNTRFGDPETQVVLPLLENDLIQVLTDVLAGRNPHLQWEKKTCVGVVVASGGYPGAYAKNVRIPSIPESDATFTIHAGTKKDGDGWLVSNGGRVLLVGAKHETRQIAADAIYHSLDPLGSSEAFFYRRDIGRE